MNARQQRTNAVMADLLARRRSGVPVLDRRLSGYLQQGVVGNEGFVLLKAELRSSSRYDPKLHFDETGFECLVNHIHIDPVEGECGRPLDLGVAYAESLANVLQQSGFTGPFRIILSYRRDDDVCTVRFHRVREGQNWLASDLKDYKDEGLLVIDC